MIIRRLTTNRRFMPLYAAIAVLGASALSNLPHGPLPSPVQWGRGPHHGSCDALKRAWIRNISSSSQGIMAAIFEIVASCPVPSKVVQLSLGSAK
jgi:hypothetical protein